MTQSSGLIGDRCTDDDEEDRLGSTSWCAGSASEADADGLAAFSASSATSGSSLGVGGGGGGCGGGGGVSLSSARSEFGVAGSCAFDGHLGVDAADTGAKRVHRLHESNSTPSLFLAVPTYFYRQFWPPLGRPPASPRPSRRHDPQFGSATSITSYFTKYTSSFFFLFLSIFRCRPTLLDDSVPFL